MGRLSTQSDSAVGCWNRRFNINCLLTAKSSPLSEIGSRPVRAALCDDTMTTAARKTNREASYLAYLLFTVRTSRKSFGVDFVRRKGQYLLISNRRYSHTHSNEFQRQITA